LATNASGGIEWQARYKPFGETRWISGTLTTNRKPALSAANGFNGMKEESALGGIYDFNARFYDPVIGRFLSADTIVPRPSDPQSLNRFSFVRNNPLKYVDPSGHDIAIATGRGEDIRVNGIADDRYDDIISVYKGWSAARSASWRKQWNTATDENREKMEHAAGIRFLSYSSGSDETITEQDVQNVQTQLEGFKDITMIGYSKGANLVENYIAYKHQYGFDFGPDVNKFVIMKAPMPGGSAEWYAGGKTPGAPFGTFRGRVSFAYMNGFSQGSVVNIYGVGDPFGSQGPLVGATANFADQSADRTTHVLPHGVANAGTIRTKCIW
jgi:RHS repeat-associated protein